MRWDELFADIESQLEQELDAERLGVAAEEERLRVGRLGLRERVLAMGRGGAPLTVQLADGETVAVRVETAGRDWIAGDLVADGPRRTIVVPLAAVTAILPAGDQLERGLRAPNVDPPAADLAARLGVTFVIRDLCRRRSVLELRTTGGVVTGTVDRVGRDHLDVAEHELGDARRPGLVRRIRLIPLDALLSIRL